MNSTCKHCGKPIDFFPGIQIEGLQWKHSDGFYNCDGNRGHSLNYAEPIEQEAQAQP